MDITESEIVDIAEIFGRLLLAVIAVGALTALAAITAVFALKCSLHLIYGRMHRGSESLDKAGFEFVMDRLLKTKVKRPLRYMRYGPGYFHAYKRIYARKFPVTSPAVECAHQTAMLVFEGSDPLSQEQRIHALTSRGIADVQALREMLSKAEETPAATTGIL